MGFKAVINFVAGDQYTAVANRVARSTQRISDSIKRAGRNAKASSERFKQLGSSMKSIGQKVTIAGAAVTAFALVALKNSAQIETMEIAFNTLTGSVKKGKAALADVIAFTSSTPFQLEGVAGVATGLISVGFHTKDLTSHLRVLGDIAAGTQKPLKEIAQAFLKSKATGKFNLEIMNMFLEKNIDLWPALVKSSGKTKAALQDMMGKGMLTFSHLNEALKSMSAEGGIFYQMTEKMSGSLSGLVSTTKDGFGFAFAAIGDTISEMTGLKDILKSIISKLAQFKDAWPEWVKENPALAKFAGILAMVVIVGGPLLMMFGQMIIMMAAIQLLLPIVGAGFIAAFWPIVGIIAGITALVLAGLWLHKNWDAIVHGIQITIQSLLDSFMGVVNFVKDIPSSFLAFLGMGDTAHTLTGNLSSSSTSQSEIKLIIEAPAGVIKQVESDTAPGTTLDTGVIP